jgi:type VI secretion system protein ImpL
MIDLQSVWPYALAAVVLLALGVLTLLLLLLRRSAKASKFADASEPPPPEPKEAREAEEAEEDDSAPDAPGKVSPLALRLAFGKAGRRFDRAAAGDRHRVPFFLLLGTEGSRDSDLLANAGLELPFGPPAESGTDLGRGRGFWFLDRGVVLDLAGETVLAADGRSSDEGTWRTALHLLQKLRPKRPLDGVILAVSCQELIEAQRSEAARDALADRAGRVYRKLWQMQRRLGFRATVYLLVTGAERLPGFGGFCDAVPHRLRDEMLGWSSPYGVEVAYRGAMIDEAFSALCGRMDDLQMEVFTEAPAGAESAFLLPAALRGLQAPLRTVLDQIFKPSAYHESLALRGVYLCGRDETPESAEEDRIRRTYFLRDLLDDKAFREAGLATPTASTALARSRSVRIARAATAAAAVLYGGGLLWAHHSLGHQSAVFGEFLGDTLDHLRQERQTRREELADSDLKEWALHLLNGMTRFDFDHFGSAFVPSSWFSPFQQGLERSISRSFEEIILQAVRQKLEEDAWQLMAEADVREIAPSLAAPASGSAEPLRPLAQVPELVAFQRYVSGMQQLAAYGRKFNRLGEARDLEPLGELVKYAFKEALPPSFFAKDDIYRRALSQASYQRFDASALRSAASLRAEKLASELYAALFRRSPLAARLEALALSLQVASVQRPVAGDTQRFQDLVDRMRDMEQALAGTQMEWAFRREFNLGPDFAAVLGAMEGSEIFDPASPRRIREAGAGGWVSFQRYLASVGSPLTGPILAVRDGRPDMQLSADTLLLQSALKAFLGQGFIASQPAGQRIQVDLPPGTRLAWDPVLLDQAAAVTSAYERFRDKGLGVLPEDLRPALDAVAQDRTRVQAVDLIARAETLQPVPPAVSQSLMEDELRSGIAAFQSASRPVGDLAAALGRVRLDGTRADLSSAMTAEAFRLLRNVDRLLQTEEPYRPRLGGFAWWDGAAPPSPAAWGVTDPADVAVYLETTRARVDTLARTYAQPLLSWMAREDGSEPPPEVRTLAGKWQSVLDDLRDYEAKKPGNAVAALEDYVANRMPAVEPRSCGSAAAPAVARSARSFFSASLSDLSRQLSSRCYSLAGSRALDLYEETARYFNQRLAGRYPFTDQLPGPGVPEADAEDVRAFFRLYDRSQAVIRSVPENGGLGQALAGSRRFYDQMARVRAFFAPFLDAEKPQAEPSFDVEAAFRVLREREVGANQIIGWVLEVGGERVTDRDAEPRKLRWTPGEPVRLILRWASDGIRMPVLTPQQASRPGVTVRDRSVVYEYTNRWSLLAAVADHRASVRDLPSYADTQPVTLALAVFTQPSAGGPAGDVPTQVFLRMTLLAPGTTQSLDPPAFPDRAPLRDDPEEEDVL